MVKSPLFRRIWHYMRPYKFQFFGAIFMTVVMTAASAIEPFVLGLAITELTNNVVAIAQGLPGARINVEYIGFICILYFIRGLFFHIPQFLSQYWLTNVVQKAIFDLRNDISTKMNRLPVSFFDNRQAGDILSRMTNDVDAISNALQQSFIQVVTAILSISFAIIMMFLLHWGMAFILIAFIPITYYSAQHLVRLSQPAFKQQADALGALFGYTQEQLTGFTEIKVYGKQAESIEEFKKRNEALKDYGFKASFLSAMLFPTLNLVSNLSYIAVALVGTFQVIAQRLTVGNLQAFVNYVWQINQPIQMITQLSGVMQSAVAASQRVFEFLDEEEEDVLSHEQTLPTQVRGLVEFDHVRFGYKPDYPLMKAISFKVQPGEMVAVVGPTGAGKTTLINLLMRFYDIDSGAITIDGIDTKTVSRQDLRRHFGMVLQDAWLYTDTIRENIRFGALDATDDDVMKAAEIANVNHFIKTLPNGYNMEINEEANNISLGQKQLMTIARAVLADPDILILDEATSSVDTRLEQLIQSAMDKVMEGRTSFVIAHRLSTIRNANLILVMREGNIIEHGTHDQLIAANGFYAELYHSQFNQDTPVDIHMSY